MFKVRNNPEIKTIARDFGAEQVSCHSSLSSDHNVSAMMTFVAGTDMATCIASSSQLY